MICSHHIWTSGSKASAWWTSVCAHSIFFIAIISSRCARRAFARSISRSLASSPDSRLARSRFQTHTRRGGETRPSTCFGVKQRSRSMVLYLFAFSESREYAAFIELPPQRCRWSLGDPRQAQQQRPRPPARDEKRTYCAQMTPEVLLRKGEAASRERSLPALQSSMAVTKALSRWSRLSCRDPPSTGWSHGRSARPSRSSLASSEVWSL